MGFTPAQIDQMSAWEFGACVTGVRIANGGKDEDGSGKSDPFDLDGAAMGIEGF